MVDKSLIGLSGPSFDVWLEMGKVREFARAIYSRHPAYLETAAPVIPPTLLAGVGHAWGYTLEQPGDTPLRKANLENANTLDAEIGFRFPAALPRAGEKLSARTRIADVFEKHGARAGRMVFYKASTEFHDRKGRLVAEYYTTSVLPERMPAMNAEGIVPFAERPYFQQDTGADLVNAIRPANWADLKVGDGPGEIRFPALTSTEVLRYQAATGDYNLIHHDENYARAFGYPTTISVGLLHIGALATYATNWLGPDAARSINARVLSIQWPGDQLSYDGKVTRIYEEGRETKVDVSMSCTRHTGEKTLDVAMTFAKSSR